MKITTNGVELEPKEIEQYVPACDPNVKTPSELRLLRCDYPIFDNTYTFDNIPGERMKLGSKGHGKDVWTSDLNLVIDRLGMSRYPMRIRQVPTGGPNIVIDSPSKSRYPLRSKYRTTEDSKTTIKGLDPTQESTSEDRLVIDGSRWMDMSDLPLRIAGVH